MKKVKIILSIFLLLSGYCIQILSRFLNYNDQIKDIILVSSLIPIFAGFYILSSLIPKNHKLYKIVRYFLYFSTFFAPFCIIMQCITDIYL